jgi:hypothetical protein
MTSFRIQLVIGGMSELVTDSRCIAADRVLVGARCEASQISHEVPIRFSQRGKRRR